MGDRDWEKELADIDRRLAAEPAEAPAAPAARAPAKGNAPAAPAPRAVAPVGSPASAGPAVATGRRPWKATAGLLVRLLLTALLLAAVIVWPYETRCGAWLAAYLATIGATALGAIWTGFAAWRHRAGFVHTLALLLFGASAVLGAMEVLPRVGYAMPDPAHPAMWVCR